MSKILVDTSVVIDYLRRPDRENCLFTSIRGVFDMVMSFVTVVELYSGTSSRNKETSRLIEEIINSCEVKLVGLPEAKQAGRMRRDYSLSIGDSFVALIAIAEGLPLATLDKKDFARITGIRFHGAG